ncbi:MAG: class I SAM-dependent methyltransferase [Ignavibacteria bacterium]|nr:class I SAM-dependent methyltransferase [Ignavibacteria bacterium]
MGTSNWQNISYCVELIRRINPKTILDVGVGFGRWGILCREFLEVWGGKIHNKDWTKQIDGIEIFPDNIQEYHKYFYSKIIVDDAYKYIFENDFLYDLIIFGDVLEHFEKCKAIELLEHSMKKSKYVLLNIPIGKYWKQNEIYENKYEKHLSFWGLRELTKLNPIAYKTFRDEIHRKFAAFIFSSEFNKIPNRINYRTKLSLIITQYPEFKKLLKKLIQK